MLMSSRPCVGCATQEIHVLIAPSERLQYCLEHEIRTHKANSQYNFSKKDHKKMREAKEYGFQYTRLDIKNLLNQLKRTTWRMKFRSKRWDRVLPRTWLVKETVKSRLIEKTTSRITKSVLLKGAAEDSRDVKGCFGETVVFQQRHLITFTACVGFLRLEKNSNLTQITIDA